MDFIKSRLGDLHVFLNSTVMEYFNVKYWANDMMYENALILSMIIIIFKNSDRSYVWNCFPLKNKSTKPSTFLFCLCFWNNSLNVGYIFSFAHLKLHESMQVAWVTNFK